MLKLYGIPMSNYFSMIKNALLEKDVTFEEVAISPSQEAQYLQKSPMGKVPIIETEQGFLSESSAIIDYLEETYPAVALYPSDAFERGKVKELMRIVEHYIGTPTHNILGVMLGRDVPQAVRDRYEPMLNRGLAALKTQVKLSPFIAGDRLTYADLSAFWSLSLAAQIAKVVYGRKIITEIDGLAEWNTMMLQRAITSKLAAESKANVEKVLGKR